MKQQERYVLTMDSYDRSILLNALNALRTHQMENQRPTEPVDDLILKVAKAPVKRVRGTWHAERK